MGVESAIAWTRSTFNPWWGCVKVSPACASCYAEAQAKRYGHDVWGAEAPRRFFSDKHWAEPLKWNEQAGREGKPWRVFCSSMADVFEDRRDLDAPRARLWDLIRATPALTWLLLTKRPENVARLMPRGVYPNAALGFTAEDQPRLEQRAHHVFRLQGFGFAFYFMSCEPLLGPLETTRVKIPVPDPLPALEPLGGWREDLDVLRGAHVDGLGLERRTKVRISWVITGGESGHDRRPTEIEWFLDLRAQCARAGAAFFMKQDTSARSGARGRIPEHLWTVKEFPEVARA